MKFEINRTRHCRCESQKNTIFGQNVIMTFMILASRHHSVFRRPSCLILLRLSLFFTKPSKCHGFPLLFLPPNRLFCRVFCGLFCRDFCRVFCRLFLSGFLLGLCGVFCRFLRLPCSFGGVCSRTDVAAPDYSPDTPNPISISSL